MTSINLVLVSLFILVTVVVTFIAPKPSRWKGLLGTSLLFYYLLIGDKILVVLALSLITYAFSHAIHSGKSSVWIPLILLLIPLLLFKSTEAGNHFDNYQVQTPDRISWNNWTAFFQMVGLSYVTFNSISYLIDIKRKYILPEKNFFLVLLYLVYFPTIFSGPLHRARYLFGEFRNIEVTAQSTTRGLRLILWALFKNVVIAERIFILMTQLQGSEIGGFYYLLIGLLFFFFLYCNFSSFIDFFQGVSLLFTIQLKDNFKNRVYLSASRREFWRGWHITLNEWFRDYFFFVISRYNKKGKYTDILLLVTFLLIALWHGFSMMLMTWGFLNGLWIVIERKFISEDESSSSLRRGLGVVYHLSISSVLALIFISPNLNFIAKKIFIEPSQMPANFMEDYLVKIVVIVSCLGIMDYHYAKAKNTGFSEYLDGKPQFMRWFIYFKLVLIILVFGKSAGVENYYIQF